jgi:hypothetical protein
VRASRATGGPSVDAPRTAAEGGEPGGGGPDLYALPEGEASLAARIVGLELRHAVAHSDVRPDDYVRPMS